MIPEFLDRSGCPGRARCASGTTVSADGEGGEAALVEPEALAADREAADQEVGQPQDVGEFVLLGVEPGVGCAALVVGDLPQRPGDGRVEAPAAPADLLVLPVQAVEQTVARREGREGRCARQDDRVLARQ